MTRHYRPWDAPQLRTRRLPPATLDLETLVLVDGNPQHHALVASLWPLHHDLVTLVISAGGGLAGYMQALRRVDRAEADLTWVAPSLASGNGAALTWSRLAVGMCSALGESGVQRVYASLPADDTVAVQVFRQLGFVPYTEDVVVRLAEGAAGTGPASAAWVVDARPEHEAAVTALMAGSRPEAVAHVEGPPDWLTYPLGGHWPRSWSAGARATGCAWRWRQTWRRWPSCATPWPMGRPTTARCSPAREPTRARCTPP